MADPQTAQLLRKLHYQGIVSTPRLREILQKFHALPVQELIDHLIGDGTIDQAWVDASRHAIRIRARRQRDPEQSEQLDDAFGNLALGRGWITLAQLEAAILEQQRLGRLKLQFRVGEILLNQRLLSIDQVRELLESQGLAVGGAKSAPRS